MNNNLFKLTNTVTGEVKYCIRMSHVIPLIGAYPSIMYIIKRSGKFKDWIVEEVDGTNIPYGDIYKP